MLVTWLLESPLFMLSGRPDWHSRRHAWRWIGKSESSPVMVCREKEGFCQRKGARRMWTDGRCVHQL